VRPEDRQKEIWDFLKSVQRVAGIEELAEKFSVSSLTIRRDLNKLAESGSIIITPGGGLFIGNAAQEILFNKRVAVNWDLKRAIGRRAVELVSDGAVLITNPGSTISHFITNLPAEISLTIYTNSLSIMSDVTRFPNIHLYVLGGEYRPDTYSLYGSMSEQYIELLRCDFVFLGTDAVDENGRCLCGSPEIARNTQMMLRAGRKKILLADHTKVNAAKGYIAFAKLDDFDTWITTEGIAEKYRREFESRTHLVIAEMEE
jgi:DeoR/GlpR family transcriptional regulator of sugar metabolism